MPLVDIEMFAANVANLVSLETIIGMIAIALAYWNRFNLWTETEVKYGKIRPPRQFTTWARFMTYATAYTLSMEVIYLLLLVSPNLIRFIGDNFGAVPAVNNHLSPVDREFPLWVMVFLLGFSPHLPVLKQLEERFRYRLHQRAFIPAEAKALVQQLTTNPDFFKPDKETTDKVIQKYGRGMPENWGRQQSKNRLTDKWFRLVYLREKMELWRSRPDIERFIGHCEEDYRMFQDQFRQLHRDVVSNIERRNGNDEDRNDEDFSEYLDQLNINIIREIEKLLGRAYEFVACGILSTERIHRRRIVNLNYFGLFPNYDPGIPIVLDIVLKNAVISFAIISLTSVFYLGYQQISSGRPLNVSAGFIWALITFMMMGLCVFCALVVHRILTRKSRFKVGDNGHTLVIGPFVHQCIGFATGYLCGWLVIFPYLAIAARKEIWSNLSHSLPWPLIPAITAGYIVYYLETLKDARSCIKDALMQGSITGAVGLFTSLWAFDNSIDHLPSFIYIASSSFLIGGAIGYFFPSAYRQRIADTAAIYQGVERRSSIRINIMTPSVLRFAEESIPCDMANISTGGALIHSECNIDVGDFVQLALPGLGTIKSEVVRKGANELAVKFYPDSKQEMSLPCYLGGMTSATAT